MSGSQVHGGVEERGAAIAALALSLAAQGSDTGLLEREAVRRVAELVGDAAALWRKDDEGQIVLVAFSHWRDDTRAYMEREAPGATHVDTGVLGHAWRLDAPLLLDRAQVDEWMHLMQPTYQEYARRFGMVSMLLVPLRVRGTVVGLLGVSRDQEPGLGPSDQEFLEQIGAVIAVALENDRLLHQVRQHLAEQTRAQLAAHRAAVHDVLTGLPNRRLLMERLHAAASREGGDVVLVLLDLDGFKLLNDSYGHGAGDIALVEVSRRLQRALTSGVTSRRSTLARLGGDEFAVLLARPGPPEQDDALVAHLAACLEQPLEVAGHEVRVGASIGVARGPAWDAPSLLRHADIAMYRAKRLRLGWTRYSPELDGAAQVHLQEVDELDGALRAGGLAVAYQPLVPRAGSGDGTGRRLVEALVRWRHPRRGLLLPEQFLPLAQQSGRMLPLTRAVVDRALRDVGAWRAAGTDVEVSVNVGADVLAEPDLLPQVLDGLASRGLGPESLCLELTESEVLTPEGPALLAQLREQGLRVALDDFGTGWSSLGSLADLAPDLDRLKLDASFVRRLAEPRTARFVSGVVALVHDLGLPVVAEGVEQQADVDRLDALGVEYQQGFWHSVPRPADELRGWWRQGGG